MVLKLLYKKNCLQSIQCCISRSSVSCRF